MANARVLFRVQEFLGVMVGQLALHVGTETILEVLGQRVTYYSQTNNIENTDFSQLLMEGQRILQPQYTNETLCTVLMGSPGPQDMEFVSVPCGRKLRYQASCA